MADQNLNLLSNAEPKRDSYGFAVRPQHLQRYREYGKIYKEEEEERSEKWKNFLEQCSDSAQLCTPAVENLETSKAEGTAGNSEATWQNPGEGDDSSGEKSTYDGSGEVRTEKVVPVVKEAKRCKIQTWEPTRPSLASIEKLMSVRVKKKVCMPNDHAHLVENHLPPIDEEMCARKEHHEEHLLNSEVASQESYVDTEAPAYSSESKDTSNDFHRIREFSIIPSLETEIPATCQNDATLSSCSGDKAGSDRKEENSVGSFLTPEPFFPWKEELEFLVHGGVPKSLRGEVWQAFVGVRVRRVERYYQGLLSGEVDLGGDNKNLSGTGGNGLTASGPEKWRKQIEKVIRCIGLGLVSFNLSS